jgi:hypothetical protein
MPLVLRDGYTMPPFGRVWRGTYTVGVDERTDRYHEENGPQVDRARLPLSISIPLMAPAATQSGTIDTGDIVTFRVGYGGGSL